MEFTTHLELQSQTTRLVEGQSYTQTRRHERGFHPPRRLIRQHFVRASQADLTSTDYNSEDYQSELFPLHSPLLGESLLVSFPPLNNMLKFSGYSCLIGGPIGLSDPDAFPSRKQSDYTRVEFRGTGRRVDSSSSEKNRRTTWYMSSRCVCRETQDRRDLSSIQ